MKLLGLIRLTAAAAVAAASAACDGSSAPTQLDVPAPRFDKPDNPGGGGGSGGGKGGGETVLYEVRMSSVGATDAEFLTTASCNGYGYILAMEDGNRLVHDELPDPEPLLLDFNQTQVTWTRLHDVGKGLSGTFDDGCYGETGWEDGSLQIYFEKSRGRRTIRFTWHFDYDLDGLREHFTLLSGALPLPGGWGDGFEGTGTIEGPMELQYYLKEGNKTGRYYPISEVAFRFEITITRRS